MRILVSYLNSTNEIFSSLFKVNKHNSKNTNNFAMNFLADPHVSSYELIDEPSYV